MTFDPTEPADDTKIRDLGVVIRPNWEAIEEATSSFKPWATNFTDRTAAGIIPEDPASIPDAYITYCKQDTEGNAELFGISDANNILQLTKGAVTNAAIGETCIPGGVLIKWGTGTATGQKTYGFSAGANNFGLTDFPNNCWVVLAQPINANIPTVANDYLYVYSYSKTGFSVNGVRRITLASTPVPFTWIAIGN